LLSNTSVSPGNANDIGLFRLASEKLTVADVAFYYLIIRANSDKTSAQTLNDFDEFLPLFTRATNKSLLAQLKLCRFHVNCKAFGIQNSGRTSGLRSFAPAAELIELVDDLVAIEKNPVDRLKRGLSQFFSAVTLDIPRAVRVAQWKAILGSPIGQRVVDLIKSVVPNGVPASESAGVEICTLFSLEQLTFPSQGIQLYFSDFSEKDELYLSDLRGVFRDLIRMGCKQTWIGEALLMSYGTDRDFSVNPKLEHQFMTDFKFIKSKSVDTLLGVTIGYELELL